MYWISYETIKSHPVKFLGCFAVSDMEKLYKVIAFQKPSPTKKQCTSRICSCLMPKSA